MSGRVKTKLELISIGRNNDPQLWSIRSKTPRRCFQIENEVYIVTPQDDDEPTTIKEVLECPSKEVESCIGRGNVIYENKSSLGFG